MKTAEEILKNKFKDLEIFKKVFNYTEFIEAMEEYANQFKPVAVSDELYEALLSVLKNTPAYQIGDSALTKAIDAIKNYEQTKITTPVQSDAVEFAEWIAKTEIHGMYYEYRKDNIWHGYYNREENHYNPLTTQELYDLFKQSKNK